MAKIPHQRLTIEVDATPAIRERMFVPMNVQQFVMELLQVNAERSDYFKTCVTCFHFQQKTEVCGLAGSRPPAKVIANGCKMYKEFDDEIPF